MDNFIRRVTTRGYVRYAQSPNIIRSRRSRSATAYSYQTFPWTICRSVGRSVCPLYCGKTVDRIRMPFGIVGRTGPWMRQVVGFGDRSTGRDTLGANVGRAMVHRGLLDVRVLQRHDAALLPNYFGQTCLLYVAY